MGKSFLRIILFAGAVILIGYLINLSTTQFNGDGKKTPEEALPTDAEYEWIEGPKTDKEHRYFFLSNGNYFGTGTVIKNLRGWSTGTGSYSPLPNPLEENKIDSAYSDKVILYGLIKPKGNSKVTVNEKTAKLVDISLPEETINMYGVQGYSIWYIEIEDLDDPKKYTIKVLNEIDEVLSELSI